MHAALMANGFATTPFDSRELLFYATAALGPGRDIQTAAGQFSQTSSGKALFLGRRRSLKLKVSCLTTKEEERSCYGQLRHSSKCASALRSTGIFRPSSDRCWCTETWHMSESYVLGAQGRSNCVFAAFAFRQKAPYEPGCVRGEFVGTTLSMTPKD